MTDTSGLQIRLEAAQHRVADLEAELAEANQRAEQAVGAVGEDERDAAHVWAGRFDEGEADPDIFAAWLGHRLAAAKLEGAKEERERLRPLLERARANHHTTITPGWGGRASHDCSCGEKAPCPQVHEIESELGILSDPAAEDK